MNFYQLNEQICNEAFRDWWRVAQSTGLGASGYLFKGVSDKDYKAFTNIRNEDVPDGNAEGFKKKVIQWMEENKREKPMWGTRWLAHAMDQVNRFGYGYVPGQLGIRR